MRAHYREALFAPTFVSSFRVVLGALVECEGEITFVPATRLPDAQAVGGEAFEALMRYEHAQLSTQTLQTVDSLVGVTGPCVVLGDRRALPRIENPVDWVRKHVVPHPQ